MTHRFTLVLRSTVIAFAPLTWLACSSSPAPVIDPAATNADVDAADASAADVAVAASKPAIDAAKSPDAAPVDDRIDPIELGRSWTYDVTIIGTYPLCKSGTNTGRVLGTKVVGARDSFQVQSFCPGAGTSSYALDGDRVHVYYGGAWLLALDSPVSKGHSWSNGAVELEWEGLGSQTVPAGTFADCWNARQKDSENFTTFCRGVGPVHWHYLDSAVGGNGYDAVLTAYDL